MKKQLTFSDGDESIVPVRIEEELKGAYLDYAMSVIIGRAIPDARDGLKPVQRRILYAMWELGLLSNRPYKKSARVVGEVLGKYHPHGDTSVYEALVRMVQDFNMRYPLVDGQGNFGSMDGDPPAAMRYTEVRMAKIAEEFLKDIEKETVDFVANFDGSFMEPVVLPTKIPNLLINGTQGIAVGMATSIPPHNLVEIIDAILYILDNPDSTLDDIMSFIRGPDFPTGGVIMGIEEVKKAYETGRGSITLRGKVIREDTKRGANLVIVEIPYGVNKASLVERIASLIEQGKLSEVKSVRDESNREGVRIVMELKPGEDEEFVKRKLFKYTQLETRIALIFIAVYNNEPVLFNLKGLLEVFINHRKEVVTKRTEFDLRKAREREHILEGLKIAVDFLDEVITIIRGSGTPQEARERLMRRFSLSDRQAQAILDMRLQRLTALERKKIEEELIEVRKLIEDLEDILTKEERLAEEIKKELIEMKTKYGDARRTQIADADEEIRDIDLIKEEDMVVTITHRGYVKRAKFSQYALQKKGGKGRKSVTLKGGDFLEHIYIANSLDTLFIFTNTGRVFGIKVYEIPEKDKAERGIPIEHLIKLQENERISSIIHLREIKEQNFLMVSKKGMVKKTPVFQFMNAKRGGIQAMGLSEGDELVGVTLVDGEDLVIIGTKLGKAIVFSADEVRSMGRTAKGVAGMKLRNDDEVVSVGVVSSNMYVVVVTKNGYGKRVPTEELRVTGRGGIGVVIQNVTEKTGEVVTLIPVSEEDELLVVTKEGMAIRISVGEIPIYHRNTVGVKLLSTGSEVVSVSLYSVSGADGEE
ncbi:MAG: DNA gyrase subunit A [Thermosulfidibacteraceae bacterium]|jgi:DNA gyrase subunit A